MSGNYVPKISNFIVLLSILTFPSFAVFTSQTKIWVYKLKNRLDILQNIEMKQVFGSVSNF